MVMQVIALQNSAAYKSRRNSNKVDRIGIWLYDPWNQEEGQMLYQMLLP